MTQVATQNQPQVGAAEESDTRLWGKFTSLGTAYGKTIANFNPSNGSPYQTVYIPDHLQDYVQTALVHQLNTLTGFDKPFNSGGVNVTGLSIYN